MKNGLANLEARIIATFGLRARRDWSRQLPEGVAQLSQREGCSPDELLERSSLDEDFLKQLTSYLTIGETHFYRHAAHFDQLASFCASPEVASNAAPTLIWSAGCASGEEPYSMAIAIVARLGRTALSRFRILGTDLSSTAIAAAQRAEYGAWSFRGTPAWVLARHLQDAGNGRLGVEPAIRQAVRFHHASIESFAGTMSSGSVSVIFFRNVGIYLEPSALERIYQAFHRILGPEGRLLIAPSDPRPQNSLFSSLDESGTVFQLRSQAGAAAASTAPRKAPRPQNGRRGPARSKPWENAPNPGVRTPPPALPPLPPAKAETIDPLAQIEKLGDAGEIEKALSLLGTLIEADPTAAEALSIRGRMQVSRGATTEAIADLRQALFLDPEHHLARYWYALALANDGAATRALAQLRDLQQRIDAKDPEEALEDGLTTAAELHAAVAALEERYR